MVNNRNARLDDNLALLLFILHQFGVKSFEELVEELKKPHLEGYTEENQSRFLVAITNNFSLSDGFAQNLAEYDANIFHHTQHINRKRDEPVYWKYFQYISLLFMEIYLDWYFRDRVGLQTAINKFLIEELHGKNQLTFDVSDYTPQDMNKLAIWQATGSGKTLLMHMHILMIEHYLQRYNVRDEFNRYILITPNEGLSQQHLVELEASGIPARVFGTGSNIGMFSLNQDLVVEVIEITKIEDTSGVTTIAYEAFNFNNIIFVDEGHRGTSGEKWKKHRDYLSEDGFAIEYSATFGQAIKTSDKDIFDEYAKAIIFDYSYRYFYHDGYGKEYNILNIRNNVLEDNRLTYLAATFLAYYQQLRIYLDQKNALDDFNLAEPLMVLVGASVTQTIAKQEASDMVTMLLFLQDFVKNREDNIQRISAIVKGMAGLHNDLNQDVFADRFEYLAGQFGEQIYDDILRYVFHASASRSDLVVEDLKSIEGEIGLRIGVNDYFGVINVGDDSKRKLLKICEEAGLFVTERDFSHSLFENINNDDSQIRILLGAKKFTEGWNSWRVSTMGLMNVGKSQGSQIIQLFGRGVRLKGHSNTLKRSSRLDDKPDYIPPDITVVETLNIFGINANYMDDFKEFLQNEGLPTEDNTKKIIMPVVENLGKVPLKWFELDPNRPSFKRVIVVDTGQVYTPNRPVQLDLYAKLQTLASSANGGLEVTKATHHLDSKHLAFVDKSQVFLELASFKREKKWSNLRLDIDALLLRLLDTSWYEIRAPHQFMDLSGFNRIRMWQQDVVIPLLKKYLASYYLSERERYESQHRIYTALTTKDDNFLDSYEFIVEASRHKIIEDLENIKSDIEHLSDDVQVVHGVKLLMFSRHLYRPLVYIDAKLSYIRVVPTNLNDGEKRFVEDLREYYRQYLKDQSELEIYLLRNQSRGKGLGFFEANNFYPDFVMWIVKDNKQYINFIDPKGIARLINGLDNPKIQFSKAIKDIENDMGDPNVVLNSFIISVTPHSDIRDWTGAGSIDDCAKSHLLFMDDPNKLSRLFELIKTQ